MKNLLKIALCVLSSALLLGYDVKETVTKVSPTSREILLSFQLKPEEHVYKESLIITANSPHVTLSQITPSEPAVSLFDENYKAEKMVYKGPVTFSFKAESDTEKKLGDLLIHTHFMINTTKEPQEKTFPLSFNGSPDVLPLTKEAQSLDKTVQSPVPPVTPKAQPSLSYEGSFIERIVTWIQSTVASIKETLSSLFTGTGSRAIRFASAFLLGVLLSFTPCIYPLIPITIGILQASGTTSALRNFFLALSYTLGISTVFALLGFIAALGGSVFGELQGSPFVVIPLALLFLYFGLSMFDFVTFYVPKFLTPKTDAAKGGSFLSAYALGALSGTIASPCLSPGLVLLLHHVASVSVQSYAGYLEGFLLLFIFGIGSSLLLLFIGTFSGSLKYLPQSGVWMIEIKKIVGIMLIATALYQLSYLERIIPWYIFVWVVVGTFLFLGIYYFVSIDAQTTRWTARYKNLMGAALIVTACLIALQGVKAVYEQLYPTEKADIWLHDYEQARAEGQATNRLLFIDIGATNCSVCRLFEKKIFGQTSIEEALKKFVPLQIKSDLHIKEYEQVKTIYGSFIKGFPTYLVVNPATEKVVKKWSVDIDELGIAGLERELVKLASL